MNWRVARWWIAANTAGAVIALAVLELNYQRHARAYNYNPHPPRYALHFLFWLAYLIVVGAVDALVCCWLDSFIRIRNKALHVTVAVAIGVTMAVVIPIAAAVIADMTEMVVGVFILLPTGVFFGSLLGVATPAEPPPAPGAKR